MLQSGAGQHRRGTVLWSVPWSSRGCNSKATKKAATGGQRTFLFLSFDDGEHRRRPSGAGQTSEG
uniref:Uncharacterized protein n=1 Tax=Triticum urartu TaxID=4572 RepID=A0A8R7Q1X5_TRIUA